MNSFDYFNSQNFPNDIIGGGGVKETDLLDSALSIKHNTKIDTLLDYIEKDKPDPSDITMVSDEKIDLTESLLGKQSTVKDSSQNSNTSNMNTIFLIILIVIIILIIISIILYFIFRNKKNIKDKIQNLSNAINETYNSSKNTNLSNSLLNDSYSN